MLVFWGVLYNLQLYGHVCIDTSSINHAKIIHRKDLSFVRQTCTEHTSIIDQSQNFQYEHGIQVLIPFTEIPCKAWSELSSISTVVEQMLFSKGSCQKHPKGGSHVFRGDTDQF